MRFVVEGAGSNRWRSFRLPFFLAVCIVVLAVANVVQIALDVGLDFSAKNTLRVFDLSEETSLGTWFSALLLAITALVAATHGLVTRQERMRRGWLALAGLIALFSLDEVVAMHERFGVIVYEGLDLPDVLVLAWVIPAAGIIASFLVWQRRFFATLPAQLRMRLLVAGAIFVGGAVGLEVVESAILGLSNLDMSQGTTAIFSLIEVLEETAEMAAIAWALLGLLEGLRAVTPEWVIRFENASRPGAHPSGATPVHPAEARFVPSTTSAPARPVTGVGVQPRH